MTSHLFTLARLLGVLALVCGLPLSTFAQTGNLTGHVYDQNGAGSAAATVTVGSLKTTTDTTGLYNLSGIAAGIQKVTASKTFYKTQSESVTIVSGSTVTAAPLTLANNWGTITGTITDVVTTQPISNATVSVSGSTLTATTDSSGSYTFAQVTVGSKTLNVSAPNYYPATAKTTVTLGATTTANITLQNSCLITAPGSTIAWNGSNWYLLGNNYAWYNYGTDFGTGGWGYIPDWNTIASQFAAMSSQGVHVVRWWVFADGRYSPDFNANGAVSGLDSAVLPAIDQALQIAANNNIFLLFTLMDNNMWSPTTSYNGVKMGGHKAIITSSSVQQSYLNNALKPLLQHIAASPNRSSVLGYDIVNEPEAQMAGYWGGVGLSAAQVQHFVQQCAFSIHQYGGGAYATVGSATPYYVGTWIGLGLDFYQIHYYPWMDFGNGAGSGLPGYTALKLDRPCVVGEFPTSDVSYGLTDTAPLSAAWYLNTIYNNGYAGALGWSFWADDSASNWSAFQPVFTNWSQSAAAQIGPH